MVSGKEHTQSQSAREGRAGRVTWRQSANGEIKEDIPNIYPLGREHAKERLLRWKQRSEALNCWRGRINAVQPQRTGHICFTKWIPVRWLRGRGHYRDINGCKSCCFGNDAAVGSWVQCERACAKSCGATVGWKTGSQVGWYGSTAVQQPCVALNYGTSEAISSYDCYILRLKHPGKVGHWI